VGKITKNVVKNTLLQTAFSVIFPTGLKGSFSRIKTKVSVITVSNLRDLRFLLQSHRSDFPSQCITFTSSRATSGSIVRRKARRFLTRHAQVGQTTSLRAVTTDRVVDLVHDRCVIVFLPNLRIGHVPHETQYGDPNS